MTDKRLYSSPLRKKAAAETRERILRQAVELFAQRGYGRVTVADIAQAAGVASKTVFASVGSKSSALDQIVDKAVTDSGYEATVAHLLAATTPEAVLKALAHGTRTGNEGQFEVLEAVRGALPVHEDSEALWARATAAYRQALDEAAQHLRELSPAVRDTPREEIADMLWFWFGPTSWRTLVTESGWSWSRAEGFLYRTAGTTLGVLPAEDGMRTDEDC
ncbi:TetR/AcrR family transcriptional regulator [Streptomyces sp. NBC_01317]|uniref:TetR/AcrR family transcriptional regulator n=1 Tax=Streptomyces sp. NBC_01317 TaxID=2903822 RepID=UPI002E0E9EE0|nr:TetR/AcrR family transcriptional regulator [Streptomyces sp. NBC_01317]